MRAGGLWGIRPMGKNEEETSVLSLNEFHNDFLINFEGRKFF